MRKMLPFLIFPVLLGPTAILLAVTLVTALARPPSCGPAVTGFPESLTAAMADGTPVHLDAIQLGHATTIVRIGGTIKGVGRDGVVVALMAALTESRLRMLANTVYPDSADYPNDGVGSDHDSLGLFQMRPVAGWGSVAELMDPEYQARAFFGGADGPNHGSPRGLLDIPSWATLPKGAAAQAVEVSEFPDRYATYEPVAEAILDALTLPARAAGPSPSAAALQPTTRIVFPLPEGISRRTSGYGYRVHPVFGSRLLHAGTDYAAPAGTPVLALADGVVDGVTHSARGGNVVVLDHVIDGKPVATAYAHLLDGSTTVHDGEPVTAGQQIAAVGSTGAATGPHLHLEVHPGKFTDPAVDFERWSGAHRLDNLTDAAAAACTTGGET